MITTFEEYLAERNNYTQSVGHGKMGEVLRNHGFEHHESKRTGETFKKKTQKVSFDSHSGDWFHTHNDNQKSGNGHASLDMHLAKQH